MSFFPRGFRRNSKPRRVSRHCGGVLEAGQSMMKMVEAEDGVDGREADLTWKSW